MRSIHPLLIWCFILCDCEIARARALRLQTPEKNEWNADRVVQFDQRPKRHKRKHKHKRPRCGRVKSYEPGHWIGNVSADGTKGRRLFYDLKGCELQRYTVREARTCLQNKHLVLVGDSLMRYQYMSLVSFLNTGRYPPSGIPTTGANEPNVCQENDYVNFGNSPARREWMASEGLNNSQLGWPTYMIHSNRAMQGKERCDCHRGGTANTTVENHFYHDADGNLSVSYFNYLAEEFGGAKGHYPFADKPPSTLNLSAYENIGTAPVQWQANRTAFINNVLPLIENDQGVVSAVLWNQGIWSAPSAGEVAETIRLTRPFFEARKARAFWKGTSRQGIQTRAGLEISLASERELASSIERQRWEHLDVAHIVKNLTILSDGLLTDGEIWTSLLDKGALPTLDPDRLLEFSAVHWDLFHYRPWVYEELNNVWLNMLCNV